MIHVIEWAAFIRGGSFEENATALSVGVFDGVHRGHRALIRRLTDTAAERSLVPAAVTFREHPRRLLLPREDTACITTIDEKIALFERAGLAACVVIDFSDTFRQMRGEQFIDTLREKGRMRHLAIGSNFRCGAGGAFRAPGIKAYLEPWQKDGVSCDIAPPVLDEGRPVSSSRIRAALAAGNTALAERLLGYPLPAL